jgi:hypothetical protein
MVVVMKCPKRTAQGFNPGVTHATMAPSRVAAEVVHSSVTRF